MFGKKDNNDKGEPVPVKEKEVTMKPYAPGTTEEMPPQPKKVYYKKKDLVIGQTYFCRLSGMGMLVTEVDETKGKPTEAIALMWRRAAEAYTAVDLADDQLFLFDGVASQV